MSRRSGGGPSATQQQQRMNFNQGGGKKFVFKFETRPVFDLYWIMLLQCRPYLVLGIWNVMENFVELQVDGS